MVHLGINVLHALYLSPGTKLPFQGAVLPYAGIQPGELMHFFICFIPLSSWNQSAVLQDTNSSEHQLHANGENPQWEFFS